MRLYLLKRRARKLARKLRSILDGYPCGYSLAMHLSPEAPAMAEELRTLWERIRELDPSAPNWPMRTNGGGK